MSRPVLEDKHEKFTRIQEQIIMVLQPLVCLVVVAVFAVVAAAMNHRRKSCRIIVTTEEAAIATLGHLQEWAKWIMTLQAAVLAVFGVLLKNCGVAATAKWSTTVFIITTVMTFLCGAWLFSAVPFARLELGKRTNELQGGAHAAFNVYEYPLYAGTSWPPISYIIHLQHWFAAGSVISLAWNLLVGT
jgi:hypothetical protein